MYLYNLDCDNYLDMIVKNKIILIGVYEKKCILSDLFKGVMQKINNTTSKNVTVALIEKDEYNKIYSMNEKQIFPIVLEYKNGINIKKIYGFNNYFTLIKELKTLVLKK